MVFPSVKFNVLYFRSIIVNTDVQVKAKVKIYTLITDLMQDYRSVCETS